MRKLLALVILALALVAAGCGEDEGAGTSAPAPATSDADPCTKDTLALRTPGELTIGTDNPAFSPYFTGGPGHEWKGEFNNDPYTGEGFEAAVAYAVAEQLGFTEDEVVWTVTPFPQLFKPGEKNFDFYLAQASIRPKRQEAADFSQPYYEAPQAVVTLEDSEFANVTSLDELTDAKLGAEEGTTSLEVITEIGAEPLVYGTTADATRALTNGQIDGMVVDYPTAYYIAFVEPGGGKIVGQIGGTGGGAEPWGIVLAKDSPLTTCVDTAVGALKDDGTLAAIEQEWLSDLVGAPVLE